MLVSHVIYVGVNMQIGDKVGIVCCSNGQPVDNQEKIIKLQETLKSMGLVPVLSKHIYQKNSIFCGTAQERAESLMAFYQDSEIKAIFDISGGDLANEILEFLDYDQIAAAEKLFWGYSDLTTILNAIYTKTGKSSVLYQIRNVVDHHKEEQRYNFRESILHEKNNLWDFSYEFVQGEQMEGIVVGGNIRCLLKLAGTEYWPDMTGKVLLLEAYSGTIPQMVTFLSQLKQIGVFRKVQGILLGTFTQMEKETCCLDIVSFVKQYAGSEIPIVKTQQIGHGTDSKGIIIGQYKKWC